MHPIMTSTTAHPCFQDLASDRQQLQTAEERNANLEREVALHKQRVEIEREVSVSRCYSWRN